MIPLLFAIWTVDRIEPPVAVLVGPREEVRDVLIVDLPPGLNEGDRLGGLYGPRLTPEPEERRRLEARIARMAGLATGSATGQGEPMGRRHQDHFARRARQQGFRARSVYKLQEIDRRTHLFRGGQRVLDLGCAPGSWTQFAAERVGPKGLVVGVDLRAVAGVDRPNVRLIQADVFETPPQALLQDEALFDVVISDMAPATSGNRFTDHARSIDLCRRALALAGEVLQPGGAFVCKAFEGGDLSDLVTEIRARFGTIKRIKPDATRSESVELFVVAKGFRP